MAQQDRSGKVETAPTSDAARVLPRCPDEELARLAAALSAEGPKAVDGDIFACLETWPSDPRLHLLRIRQLDALGDGLALDAQLAEARRRFPRNARIALHAFRRLLATGHGADARALFEAQIWCASLPEGNRLEALESLCAAIGDEGDRAAFLGGLLKGGAQDRFALLKLAELDLAVGRTEAGLARFGAARALGEVPQAAWLLEIETRLKAGQADETVGTLLDGALERHSDLPRFHTLKCDFHEARGEREALARTLAAARTRFPRHPWLALRQFNLDLSAGRLTSAGTLLRAEVWSSPLPEATRRRALGAFTRAWTDSLGLDEALAELMTGGPDDRFVLTKRAGHAMKQRAFPEALAMLDQALSLGPLPREAEAMQVDLLMFTGKFQEALALAKRVFAADPTRKAMLRRINLTGSVANSQEDVTQSIIRSIEQWPDDHLLLQRYNRAAFPREVDRALFDRLQAHARTEEAEAHWQYQYALACLRHRDTPQGYAILQQIVDKPQIGFFAQRVLTILQSKPLEAWDATARFDNDTMCDFRVVTKPGARATFLVLSGVRGDLGGLPFTHVDVLLADHPVNVIYLRDNSRRAFTGGLPSLGADEASMIAALRRHCDALDNVPAIPFGGSFAGWSAIRLAVLMGAPAALSLSAPVMDPTDESGNAPMRLSRRYIASVLPPHARDLAGLVRGAPGTTIFHAYGAQHLRDGQHANELRDVPNVVTIPVDSDDHFIASDLIAQGLFHPLVARVIEAAAGAASKARREPAHD
ncbi:tetratricopeptide repeat protein [Aquabacter sp. P-9]|uniref:tetratricopeptide repeat protein n=1 Tax=Aquabacter sediminis TaxID=3029197 RepID=UPI00237E3A37|nr:tetratricopeptide repeat protein [Aquabacter sp. P-9]MDE1568024.1 hypothetical protein [Aquabacter sp. P-9]